MALDGQIAVSTELLRNQSGEAKKQVEAMAKGFEQLKVMVNGTSSYWIGSAGDAHRKQYEKRISQIEKILARYRGRITELEEMAGIFDDANKAAVSAAEGLPQSTV